MNYKHLLFWRHRPDGDMVKPRDAMQKLMPHIMRTRAEACIYYRQCLDLTTAMEFIKTYNAKFPDQRLTIFILILTAMIRTARKYPHLNRFIAGKKLYTRNSLQISYVVKRALTIEGTETLVKQTFAPDATLGDVAYQVDSAVNGIKRGKDSSTDALMNLFLKLPGLIISAIITLGKLLNHTGLMPAGIIISDPLCTSAIVANIGSIGAGAPFHHLYEWGTASLFLVIGRFRQNPDNGKTEVEVTFTMDERIADGYYFAQAVQYFQELVEAPERLQLHPDEVRTDG